MDGTYGSDLEPQKKGFAVSIVVHTLLIALVVFLSGPYVGKPLELTTIFINNGAPPDLRTDKAGGDGRKAGSEGTDNKAAKGAPGNRAKRTIRTVNDKAQVVPPETESAWKPTSAAKMEALPGTASSFPENADNTALRGIGEGLGGGGGKGLGSYGAGSGFGGTGRDGMGGGTGRGAGGPRKADVERYLAEHYKYIKDLIAKHIVYPPLAKKMGWEGRVKVSFTISEKGAAQKLKVLDSSGYGALDENLMDTIKEVQPFPKPPAPADLDISITYRLDKM